MKTAQLFLRQLAGDCTGVSVIETALVAPIVLMLMAGTVDLAMGFALKVKTQQAAARAVEYATTTTLDSVSTTNVQSQAATGAGVPASQVTVSKWLECDGVTQSSFDLSCDTGAQTARYLSVSISNTYHPTLAALVPSSVAIHGDVTFTGHSSVRLQ